MTEPNPEKQKQLAIRIASTANSVEKKTLLLWIEQLLEIKSSSLPTTQKVKEAISVTSNNGVTLQAAKMIARETKRLVWDDRGLTGKFGLFGILSGLALFGGQGAGIAALGTAIGVPLWVVFGAGAAFLGVLYEEITGKGQNPKTTCRVIDAEPENKE